MGYFCSIIAFQVAILIDTFTHNPDLQHMFFYGGMKVIKTLTKIIFHFTGKGLQRLTFFSTLYQNRWIGFVDIAMSTYTRPNL